MAARTRRWLLALALGVVATAGAGCDPKTMAYFLMPEAKQPAELKQLTSDDKKKKVRVVILTYMPLETRPEVLQADRELSEMLGKRVQELAEADEKKVE